MADPVYLWSSGQPAICKLVAVAAGATLGDGQECWNSAQIRCRFRKFRTAK